MLNGGGHILPIGKTASQLFWVNFFDDEHVAFPYKIIFKGQ
jgi:hypothetical protein